MAIVAANVEHDVLGRPTFAQMCEALGHGAHIGNEPSMFDRPIALWFADYGFVVSPHLDLDRLVGDEAERIADILRNRHLPFDGKVAELAHGQSITRSR